LSPDFGPTVYSRFILLKTLAAVASRASFSPTGDVRELIESVYDDQPRAPGGASELGVTDDELLRAWEKLQEERTKMVSAANRCLIPKHSEKAFRLGQMETEPYEEEGQAGCYFHAATRYGERTCRIVLLEGDAFRRELDGDRRPPRSVLKDIFLHQVSVPLWWIRDVEPEKGYDPIGFGRKWLEGMRVLRLRDRRWQGTRSGGKPLDIRYDEDLGIFVAEHEQGSTP